MQRISKLGMLAVISLTVAGLTGCNGTEGPQELGRDELSGPPAQIPGGNHEPNPEPTPTTTPTSTPVTGSCHSDDPSRYCLGLKYVVYKSSAGTPVVTQEEAQAVVDGMNSIWSQCKIAFQIDEYRPETPSEHGLVFNTANSSELNRIRARFDDEKTLLVVTTGRWNRNGTLGNTGANAWTAMPGGTHMGAVLESPVGTFYQIIAHELGHYLNLDHASASTNLMSPVIYDNSEKLSASQCTAARSAINYYWKAMLR